MKARYQYRFYPTTSQQTSLAQLFGCVRVAWNDALAFCKNSDKYPGYNLLSSQLTASKKTDCREWLRSVSSVPLQQSVKNLDVAFKNFFNSCKGTRKGKQLKYPRFKNKTNTQSASFTKASFSLVNGSIYLAKIGNIEPIWSRDLPSAPSSVTVIKDAGNRYFLSFVVEVEPINIEAKNHSIGIDLGIKTFAFMSNGEKIKSPDYSKLDRKVRRHQRKMSRQLQGSIRRNKTRLQIAKTHNHIADIRKDFLHKLSTKVVRENQSINLEDLNVSGMVKNRKLSRAISLQGWGTFREFCEAKAEKYGRAFNVINRWEPTSQVCSSCGFKWGKLDLKVRTVTCINCGEVHDRDENAAKNIDKVGMGHRHDSKRTARVNKSTLVAKPNDLLRITVALAR